MSSMQENISKLISYWLRHNPSDADIELDSFGYANLTQLISSLYKKGYNIDKQGLIDLNNSFDKIRWKINIEKNLIKATHGHSFPIILEENSQNPPEILYHGTCNRYLIGILEQGLISKDRKYVHLSENVDLAREVGQRHGLPFVIEISTKKLIDNGWKFYKTEQNIWLTSNIPAEYLEFQPWKIDFNIKDWLSTKNELIREVSEEHMLFGILDNLVMRGSYYPSDDCLFEDLNTRNFYVIHPTWSGKKEKLPWPNTDKYETFEDWINNRLIDDQEDWY